MEIRAFEAELRLASEGRTIEGVAVPYNTLSVRMWGFREKIAPGAFTESLADSKRDVFALWNHNSDFPLASRRAKSLVLTDTDAGLRFSFEPNDTVWGESAHRSIKDGIVTRMSFGFHTVTDEWHTEEKEEIRTIRKAELYEISPVLFPAYNATSVEARSVVTPEEVWKERQQHLAKTSVAGQATEGRGFGIAELLALNFNRRRNHGHKA